MPQYQTDFTVINPRRISVFLGLLKLMRPKQWIKNSFVIAPLIFSGKFTDASALIDVLIAVAVFCVASSAAYIVNDYSDIEADRNHPQKSIERPLALGLVSKVHAFSMLAILYTILVIGCYYQSSLAVVIVAYLLLNLAYSIFLKHQPVLDIFTIAIGFVLRVYAGAMVLNVPVSAWMFVTTLCLALFLASAKRKQEINQNGSVGRKVLSQYSEKLVERYAEMSATGALLFYSLFVITTRPEMVITIPFVIFGLFRYWFILEIRNGSASAADVLISDWQLLLTVMTWAATCAWIVYSVLGS